MHALYIDIQSCVQRHLQSAHVVTVSSSLLKVVTLFCTILLLTSMVYPCWEGFLMLCVAYTPSNVCWCSLLIMTLLRTNACWGDILIFMLMFILSRHLWILYMVERTFQLSCSLWAVWHNIQFLHLKLEIKRSHLI